MEVLRTYFPKLGHGKKIYFLMKMFARLFTSPWLSLDLIDGADD